MSSATLNPPAVWTAKAVSRAQTGAKTRLFAASLGLVIVALFASPIPFGSVLPMSQAALTFGAILATLCWWFGCIRTRRLTLNLRPLHWIVLASLLLVLTQYLGHTTADPVPTRDALIALLTWALVFFLTTQVLYGRPDATWLHLGLAFSAYLLLLSLFGILQFFSSNGMLYWSVKAATGFGPYVNRDHYAGLMEMIIPLVAAYLLAERRQGARRPLAAIALLVGIASTLLCGSRAGMIALAFEGAILLLVLVRKSRSPGRSRQAAAVLVAIVLAVILFFWADPGGTSERLAEVFQPNRANDFKIEFATREQATLDCLHMLRVHPWLGQGLGSFNTEYPRYKSFADDLHWFHAQNDYAEALAETGIAGGILIFASITLFVLAAFRNLKQRLSTQAGWIQFGAALGCCGLLIHSFADFNLHIPANATWFAFCAACATLGQRSTVNSSKPTVRN